MFPEGTEMSTRGSAKIFSIDDYLRRSESTDLYNDQVSSCGSNGFPDVAQDGETLCIVPVMQDLAHQVAVAVLRFWQ